MSAAERQDDTETVVTEATQSETRLHGFPAERERVFYPAAVLLLMSAGFILLKTSRDALYFQQGGLLDLPWAYLGIAMLSIPMASMVLTLFRRFGPRKARIIATSAMAVAQIVFFALARPGGGWLMTFFFVLIPVVYGVLFAMAWLLGAELLESETQEALTKSYGALGAATMIGGMAGGLLAKGLADHLGPNLLSLVGTAGLSASIGVMKLAYRRFPQNWTGDKPRKKLGKGKMPNLAEMISALAIPYVRGMLGMAMIAGLVGVLIEFQFYLSAAMTEGSDQQKSHFFANFYIVLSAAALLLQLLAVPYLQRRIGLNGSLLVLPMALLSGSGALVVTASGLGRVALRVAEGGLKSSIYRTNWEQTYLPLPGERRGVAKVLVEGLGIRMAEGIGAGILILWFTFYADDDILGRTSVAWLGWAILGGTALWIVAGMAFGRQIHDTECERMAREHGRPEVPIAECCPVTASLGEEIVGEQNQRMRSDQPTISV